MSCKSWEEVEIVNVGWVQKAHGIKGEIYVRFYNPQHPQREWLHGLESFVLNPPSPSYSRSQNRKDTTTTFGDKKNTSTNHPKEFEFTSKSDSIHCVLKQARPHKEGIIIQCLECNDRNRAEELKGYTMGVPQKCLVAPEGEIYLNQILNFEVIVKNRGVIGHIQSFKSHKVQDNLIIKGLKWTYEIPFVDEYIDQICFDSSQVYLTLPEGLLELYEPHNTNLEPTTK